MKKIKQHFQFYTLFYLLLIFLFFVKLAVNGQTGNEIEQDPGVRAVSNQVNTDLQNRLPQRNLRRTVPVEMLEIQLVTVPQLVGRNYNIDQITSILDRYGLQLGRVIPAANNDSIGLITTQSPGIRQRVRPQTPVNITYGIAMPVATPTQPQNQTVRVPNYVGLTIDRAVGRMPNDRLRPGNVNEVFSGERPGIVVSQFPEFGTPVDPGTEVILDVSMGQQPEIPVRVPRLIGLTLQQAAEMLREAGLFVGNISERISGEPEGIIIEQSPGPNSEVLRESTVDITYSIHEDPILIPVPNVIQLFQDEAIRILKENDLNYLIEYANEPRQTNGIVVKQNPLPQTLVEPGSFVTIFINDKPDVPPWIYWTGGILAAGLLGGFIGRKLNTGRKKRLAGEKKLNLELKPVLDIGKQSISSEKNNLTLNNLQIKYISDTGIQTIKTN